MVYRDSLRITGNIRAAVELGGKIVTGLLGLGVITFEFKRVLALPPSTRNYLYLSLLCLVALLIAGWYLVSKKELDLLSKWLDPKDYAPPDEWLLAIFFAVLLVLLFFASRSPLLFGVAYLVYTTSNVFAVRHMRSELIDAISKSRERLKGESEETRAIRGPALDILERYYASRRQVLRVLLTVILAVVGFLAATYGRLAHSASGDVIAYAVYICSISGLEGIMVFRWRVSLYGSFRALDAALYEQERNAES